jgi:hypothetical protein
VHFQQPRTVVVFPVRKRRDHIHPVEALRFSQAYIIFESRIWPDRPADGVIVPFEPTGPQGEPGVANCDIRRTVGMNKRVLVGGYLQKTTAQRIFVLFRISPFYRVETTALP